MGEGAGRLGPALEEDPWMPASRQTLFCSQDFLEAWRWHRAEPWEVLCILELCSGPELLPCLAER